MIFQEMLQIRELDSSSIVLGSVQMVTLGKLPALVIACSGEFPIFGVSALLRQTDVSQVLRLHIPTRRPP
jgi:hypothetical protein